MLHGLLAMIVALFVLLSIQSLVKALTLYKSLSISSCTCLKVLEDLQRLQADVFPSQCCCWSYFHIFQWLHYHNDCIWLWGLVCIVWDFLSLILKPIFESSFSLLLELISAANSSLQCHVLNLLLLDKVYKDDKKEEIVNACILVTLQKLYGRSLSCSCESTIAGLLVQESGIKLLIPVGGTNYDTSSNS